MEYVVYIWYIWCIYPMDPAVPSKEVRLGYEWNNHLVGTICILQMF